MKLIDLSQPIVDNMPVHPYDDQVRLFQDKTLDKDKYNNFKLEIGMHAGTHIDAPMHLTESKQFINQIPLDQFIGRGCLLDVRGEIEIGHKEGYEQSVLKGDIVLLYTGHSQYYGTDSYYKEHPVITEELADLFIRKQVKMVGMDLPSPDDYPFNIHKKLFSEGILIIENLTNLSQINPINQFEVIAFPLNIQAEASPLRVVAKY